MLSVCSHILNLLFTHLTSIVACLDLDEQTDLFPPAVFFMFLCRLALYVYEYLLHVGAQKSAQTFLSEVSHKHAVCVCLCVSVCVSHRVQPMDFMCPL